MDPKQREELTFSVAKSLAEATEQGRDHDVIRDGILLYLANRQEQNADLDSVPLGFVQSAIERIMKPPSEEVTSSPECSFCGLTPPEVKLAAGPNVFICNRCVELLSDGVFSERD
jgi:hypothetical protein